MSASVRKRGASADSLSDEENLSRKQSSKKKTPIAKKAKAVIESDSEYEDHVDTEWSENKDSPPSKISKADRKTAQSSNEDNKRDQENAKESKKSTTGSLPPHFDDGFDENLVGDDEDQKRLASMTEKEREIELFKRSERREALLARFAVQKKLREKKQQIDETKLSRHKEEDKMPFKVDTSVYESEPADDIPQVPPISDRRKFNDSKKKETQQSSALEKLKADRERKRQQGYKNLEKENEERKQKPKSCGTIYSSSSSSAGSDDERQKDLDNELNTSNRHDANEPDDPAAAEHRFKATTQISTKEELMRIRLSRFKLENWCHAPFFKNVVVGTYVRIGIGAKGTTPVYRIAEVVDVVETAKIYQLENTRTNKGLRLRHGAAEKVYRIEFISNQMFSDDEFNRWRDAMKRKNLPLPTIEQVELKESEIKQYMHYSYGEEDVEKIVKEKMRFRNTPLNFAVAKAELAKEKEIAEQENDLEKLEEIKKKLSELEAKAAEMHELRRRDFHVLDAINQRNRRSTSHNVEIALMKEAEENKNASPDPFTRRKCLPTMVTKVREARIDPLIFEQLAKQRMNSDNKEINEKPEPVVPSDVEQDSVDSSNTTEKVNGLKNVAWKSLRPTAPKNDDFNDLYSAHNFEVEIDVSLPALDAALSTSTSLNTSAILSDSRRSLNLNDYKKRKGLI